MNFHIRSQHVMEMEQREMEAAAISIKEYVEDEDGQSAVIVHEIMEG